MQLKIFNSCRKKSIESFLDFNFTDFAQSFRTFRLLNLYTTHEGEKAKNRIDDGFSSNVILLNIIYVHLLIILASRWIGTTRYFFRCDWTIHMNAGNSNATVFKIFYGFMKNNQFGSDLPWCPQFSINASFRRRGLGCVGFLLSPFLPRRCMKLSFNSIVILSIIAFNTT